MLPSAVGVALSPSVAPAAPGKLPVAPEQREARAFSETESFRWVRRAVAATIPLLGVVTVSTAYADTMPIFHHTAAWIASPRASASGSRPRGASASGARAT